MFQELTLRTDPDFLVEEGKWGLGWGEGIMSNEEKDLIGS